MNISPRSVTDRFYFHCECATIKIEVDNIKLPDIKLMTSFWGDLCWNAASSNGHGWYCNSGVFSKEAGWVGQFSSDWKHCHPLFHMGWRGGWREQFAALRWKWHAFISPPVSVTFFKACFFLRDLTVLCLSKNAYFILCVWVSIYVCHMHTVPTKARRWHTIFCCRE